jgi:predicted RNA-binding protein
MIPLIYFYEWFDLGIDLCEFRVFLDDEMVMEDVVFAAVGEEGVTLRDVIGDSKVFEGVRIAEVNVPATRLVLERV